MPSPFHTRVRKALKAIADPAVGRAYQRYFKERVDFLGVRTPALRLVARDLLPAVADAPAERIVREAFSLLQSRWMEERQVGVMILHRHVQRLPADFLKRLAPVFDRTVNEWGTCDAIAGRVLRPLLVASPARCKEVVAWSRSRHPFRQRAAAVAFTAEARHRRHTADILAVCNRVVRNPHRFAQLGVGWVLRELFLADHALVLDFLARHYGEISREGLRYAVGKMPAALQRTVLASHTAARATGRERRHVGAAGPPPGLRGDARAGGAARRPRSRPGRVNARAHAPG